MKNVTLAHISTSVSPAFPAGLLYIAAVLDRAGFGVDVRDIAVKSYGDLDSQTLISRLEGSADVVGLSCMSDSLPFVIHGLKGWKEKYPTKVVILGGAGPTGVAEEILVNFPFIDIVVMGEGEMTMLEIMECLTKGDRSDLELVKGICCRLGERVCTTPERDRIRNLDSLPLPLYDSIAMERYPLINIVFSRGCPYRCTFCDVAPMWKRKHCRRSVESVVTELTYLRDRYGKKDFEFTDETFVLSRDEILDFCESLETHGVDARWSCTGRVNLISDDLLSEMSARGCQAIFYGIESGSDAILKKIEKDFSVRDALEVLHKTTQYVSPVASFIWGFPFETDDDLHKTILLAVYLSQIGVDVRLNRLAPFALSPLYDEYRDRLIWCDEQHSFPVLDPFQAGGYPGEIMELIRKLPRVFPSFYWFPADRLKEKSRLVERLGHHWHAAGWRARDETLREQCRHGRA